MFVVVLKLKHVVFIYIRIDPLSGLYVYLAKQLRTNQNKIISKQTNLTHKFNTILRCSCYESGTRWICLCCRSVNLLWLKCEYVCYCFETEAYRICLLSNRKVIGILCLFKTKPNKQIKIKQLNRPWLISNFGQRFPTDSQIPTQKRYTFRIKAKSLNRSILSTRIVTIPQPSPTKIQKYSQYTHPLLPPHNAPTRLSYVWGSRNKVIPGIYSLEISLYPCANGSRVKIFKFIHSTLQTDRDWQIYSSGIPEAFSVSGTASQLYSSRERGNRLWQWANSWPTRASDKTEKKNINKRKM